MEPIATALRRIMLLVLLAAAGGAAWSWWRAQNEPASPPDPPKWPPFEPPSGPDATAPAATGAEPAPPEPIAATAWLPPLDDGSTPDGYPIKAKDSSGIFHVPGGRFHGRTTPDRCYASAEAAEADGYRRSKT